MVDIEKYLQERRKMEEWKDKLVEWARQLASKAKGLRDTQIRNLAEYVSKTDSFEDVKLFLEYQATRVEGWKTIKRDLINYMNELKKEEKAGMVLLRLLLGYLARAAKVVKE